MALKKTAIITISIALVVIILTVVFVPPYFANINSQEQGAVLIPMQPALQPYWINASKLINTLLQLNVKVYMLSEPIGSVAGVQSETGDFIIPLAKESSVNSILPMYIQYLSSELNVTTTKIPIGTQANAYPLNKANVAIYYGGAVTGGSLEHTHALEQAGFNIAYVTKENMTQQNLSKFNVLTFPGGGPYANALNKTDQNIIKQFVSNGGGYLGTCGGSVFGVELGLLNVSNAMCGQYGDWAGLRGPITLNITDSSSPIVAGFQTSLTSTYYMGAFINRVGPDVKVICTYGAPTSNLVQFNPEIMKAYNFSVQPDQINLYWGTPSIVTGNCGSGKAVLSTTHPEILEQSQRLFVNSIFYLSSGKEVQLKISTPSNSEPQKVELGNLQPIDTGQISQANQLLLTFNQKISVAQSALSGLAETNYQVTGATGDYLKLYIDDAACRTLALHFALSNLTSLYSSLQEYCSQNSSAKFFPDAFSSVSVQLQVQQIINQIISLNGLAQTLDLVNTQLAGEMQLLQQIIPLNQTSQYYPKIIDLNNAELATLGTMQHQIDLNLLNLTFQIYQLTLQIQYLNYQTNQQ